MAIERGVDDIDIEELGIEDNSKEIVIGEEVSSDEIIDSMGEDDIQTLDDGTMVFGVEDEAVPNMMGDFNQNLAEIMDDQDLGKIFSDCMLMFRMTSHPEKNGWTSTRKGLSSSA